MIYTLYIYEKIQVPRSQRAHSLILFFKQNYN